MVVVIVNEAKMGVFYKKLFCDLAFIFLSENSRSI
jgi:hypothetical protein